MSKKFNQSHAPHPPIREGWTLVAYHFPGSATESKQLGYPEELDEEQIANCIPLYSHSAVKKD